MDIKIDKISQFSKFAINFNKKFNILYAENGTGKTTLSRIFDSINNESAYKKLKAYLEHDSTIEINNFEQKFQLKNDKTWDKKSNNFYVFNNDYYSKNIITKMGEQVYVGDDESNSLRKYLQIWWWLNTINRCQDEESFFKAILKNKELLNLISIVNTAPFGEWYLNISTLNLDQKNILKNIELLKKWSSEELQNHKDNIINKSTPIKIVKFINQCKRQFPSSLYRIKAIYYDKLLLADLQKQQINEYIKNWVFWKLYFIYVLLEKLSEKYDLLSNKITRVHPIIKDFDNDKEFMKIYNLLDNKGTSIYDESLNWAIDVIGLGYKYEVKNGVIIHKSQNQGVINTSESENKLLSLCYFFSSVKSAILSKKDPIIIIDDPINSMDGNYVLNVVRVIINLLLLDLSNRTKWIIMTHNYNFSDNLLFKLRREELDQNSNFYFMYLNNDLKTIIKEYKYNFDTAIKRIISDINDIQKDPLKYSLIDISNKVRILLEIYSSIYSGTLNHRILLENEHFNKNDHNEFESIIDILNIYSHGRASAVGGVETIISKTNINKILRFAIKLIKVYSPFIWKKYNYIG